jgi:uncharacterized protein YbjT (DUF2867 family)
MKITITGALGNVGRPLTDILLKNGNEITAISNDISKAKEIEALGAKAAIGSVSDVNFLIKAFQGADVIFTMVPPNWTVSDYVQYIADTGAIYHDAIKKSGVKRVVNLSSMGAHLSTGNGPIAGLHKVEQTLNTLDGIAIKHLRPGLFYINFFFDIAVIRSMGVMGNNYGPETTIAMAHPKDIAAIAAQELQGSFEGKGNRYVVSDELKVIDAVKLLGAAVGKPELPWVELSDEQLKAGMIAGGMSEAIANLYVEMGHCIDSGALFEDFHKQPHLTGKIRLKDFATDFAAVYNAQQ